MGKQNDTDDGASTDTIPDLESVDGDEEDEEDTEDDEDDVPEDVDELQELDHEARETLMMETAGVCDMLSKVSNKIHHCALIY